MIDHQRKRTVRGTRTVLLSEQFEELPDGENKSEVRNERNFCFRQKKGTGRSPGALRRSARSCRRVPTSLFFRIITEILEQN